MSWLAPFVFLSNFISVSLLLFLLLPLLSLSLLSILLLLLRLWHSVNALVIGTRTHPPTLPPLWLSPLPFRSPFPISFTSFLQSFSMGRAEGGRAGWGKGSFLTNALIAFVISIFTVSCSCFSPLSGTGRGYLSSLEKHYVVMAQSITSFLPLILRTPHSSTVKSSPCVFISPFTSRPISSPSGCTACRQLSISCVFT